MQSKKLILVASPPACGKTYLAKKLARALTEAVYIDKDVLNPFGQQICKLCGVDYNPDSEFFRREVRNVEYKVIEDMALEALEYARTVIVNAPFGKELWDSAYMQSLRDKVRSLGACLYIVFIEGTPEVCKERMIKRNSIRDKWKLENWEEYIKGVNFSVPTDLRNVVELYIYRNSTDDQATQSFSELLEWLNK